MLPRYLEPFQNCDIDALTSLVQEDLHASVKLRTFTTECKQANAAALCRGISCARVGNTSRTKRP